MKSKIALAAILIFLVGCKAKEIKTINKIQTDSSSYVEVKKQIEILTLQTDSGLIIEEEITDYEITTDTAGIKTSVPIKKIKKKLHKYNREIKAEEKQEIKAQENVVIKKEIKTQRIEKESFQMKWFYIIFLIVFFILILYIFWIKF